MPSELDRLINAGARLSNCAFNLKQRMPVAQLIESDLESLRSGQEEWDAARRALASVAEAEPVATGVFRNGEMIGFVGLGEEFKLPEDTDERRPLFAHPAPSGMGVNGPTDPRHFQILVEAMAEVKATSDGKSDQPIADIVQGCIDEINALPRRQALIPPAGSDAGEENWRDDPSADERWNAGLDYGQTQLCKVLGVDPQTVTWDAATETLDGDVQAVIGNILRAKWGDDLDLHSAGEITEALDARGWKSLATGLAAHLENLERHCAVQTGKTGAAHAREGVELREAGRKLIALARAALSAAALTRLPDAEWRSMDSAPKDGGEFVALNKWRRPRKFAWSERENYWRSSDGQEAIRAEYQTDYCWIPLPDALPDTGRAPLPTSLPEGE